MSVSTWVALVVDDEPPMRDIITFALETQNFSTRTAGTAAAAWEILQSTPIDLVVLDVMLPDASGVDLCRRITTTSGTPVILLTALGDTPERIKGLEAGASDYVAKPFHPRELALRAAGLVRRSPSAERTEVTSGPLSINLRTATARVGGRRLDLSTHEYKLLSVFLTHPDEVLDYARLLLLVWGDARYLGGRELLKTAVYRLRVKLEAADPDLHGIIKTVRGQGYALEQKGAAPVTDL